MANDNPRAELIALVGKYGKGLQGINKAVVTLGIAAMKIDEVRAVLGLVHELEPLVEAGDMEAVEARLADLNFPPEVMAKITEAMERATV